MSTFFTIIIALVFHGLLLLHRVECRDGHEILENQGEDVQVTESKYCISYNETQCQMNGNDGPGCNSSEKCHPPHDSHGRTALCYVLWKNESIISSDGRPPSFNIHVVFRGCWWGNHDQCSHEHNCIENRREPTRHLHFCCCAGDNCNTNMSYEPSDVPKNDEVGATHYTPSNLKEASPVYKVVGITSIFLFVLILGFTCYMMRYRKPKFNELPTNDDGMSDIDDLSPPYVGTNPVALVEIKAQGRFGAVWKATVGTNSDVLVAVKIFPPQDKQSWFTEQQVYRLQQMKHVNILSFLGAERRGENGSPFNCEYWLISEYHDYGSLSDYLKGNLVNYHELLKISSGIASGLNHLHEEISANRTSGLKPAVAHRDFKSKNVLLKNDLTACIADFGLALIFYPDRQTSTTLGQVGTRRYMAPEVLEGAINFSRDALLRIDMYACGLVLWELVSRCSAQDGPVSNYALPFEEEIGQHPTLEDMQEIVCQQKKRPEIKETWRNHPGLSLLCDTIEESWDQDAEARLTASCIDERLLGLLRK